MAARPSILRTHLVIRRPLEETFAFFADAGNLEAITPPWLNFAITSPQPIVMKPGAVIDYRLRLYGLPFRWRTVIDEWDPPHRFVDTQARGPYLLWRHTHLFTVVPDGTAVEDRVEYRVLGGRAVEVLLVRRDLRRIFTHRQHAILHHFGLSAIEPTSVTFE